MTLTSRVSRLLLIPCLAGVAVSCLPTGPDDHPRGNVQMTGTVYRFSRPSSGNNPLIYSEPVAGAVISTSLDSVTATTDASGRFSLQTGTPYTSCQAFTVTIRAAGLPTYSDLGTWPPAPTNQVFSLIPAMPSAEDTDPTCR